MATGYYHKYNVLKHKILWALGRSEEPKTAQQIATAMGFDRKRVTDELYHWHKEGYGYTQRMKRKAEGSKAYRYKITEKGRKVCEVYGNRMQNKLQLNISKKNQQRVTTGLDYYGINKHGEEMGITQEKLLEIVHLKPAKKPEPDPQKPELGEN
jgi:hypothetical protein